MTIASRFRLWVVRMRDVLYPVCCVGIYRFHAWGEPVLVPKWCLPYQPRYRVSCVRCGEWYCYEPPNR